jgi:hypothetical protein
MFNILSKDNLTSKITSSIVNNCLFEKAIIYTQRMKGINGIKLSFKDGSYGMLWCYNGKQYFYNYQAFDTIIKIPFTQEQGDKIWEKFLITFQKKYSIEDV